MAKENYMLPENIFLVMADQLIPIRKTLTKMGRHPDNDLIVADSLVSRWHAHLLYEDSRFMVQDLDSKNGVILNGKKVGEAEISSGDTITLGNTPLLFIDRSSSLLMGTDAPTGALDEDDLNLGFG